MVTDFRSRAFANLNDYLGYGEKATRTWGMGKKEKELKPGIMSERPSGRKIPVSSFNLSKVDISKSAKTC